MDKVRAFTFIDLYPDLLMRWKQDNCTHIHIDFTDSKTNDGKHFYAQGKCYDCGIKIGKTVHWEIN